MKRVGIYESYDIRENTQRPVRVEYDNNLFMFNNFKHSSLNKYKHIKDSYTGSISPLKCISSYVDLLTSF